jgi:N-acetyl-gamma-glutamylphosphate reductase
MIRAAIPGASGYVGGEQLRLLAAHPAIATELMIDHGVGTKARQEADW